MSFEVRVVRIRLVVYHPGSLYIPILAVIMYSIGPKFVFFHVGPYLVANVHITSVMTGD